MRPKLLQLNQNRSINITYAVLFISTFLCIYCTIHRITGQCCNSCLLELVNIWRTSIQIWCMSMLRTV